MTDRPILFSGPMVQALLDGRKTQTRRVLKPQPPSWAYQDKSPGYSFMTPPGHIEFRGRYVDPDGVDRGPGAKFVKLPYAPGDRLWVREAWRTWASVDHLAPRDLTRVETIKYEATGRTDDGMTMSLPGRFRQSMHMPRWASRLTLVVTDVRVQRVQDISEDEAWLEGCKPGALDDNGNPFPADEPHSPGIEIGWECARDWFADLWDSINAKRGFGWDENPWVVALTFDVHRCNINHMGEARQ